MDVPCTSRVRTTVRTYQYPRQRPLARVLLFALTDLPWKNLFIQTSYGTTGTVVPYSISYPGNNCCRQTGNFQFHHTTVQTTVKTSIFQESLCHNASFHVAQLVCLFSCEQCFPDDTPTLRWTGECCRASKVPAIELF